MTNNVVAFPKGKRNAPPQSVEEVMESMQTIRKEHIEFLTEECCSFIFGRLMDEGFDLSEERIFNESLLVVESIKSALYACSGIEHPLQQVSREIFNFDNEPTDEVSEKAPAE